METAAEVFVMAVMGISNCTTRVCNFYRAMEKLAAYEDTGLEPEEVKQLNASDASKGRKQYQVLQ